MLKSRRNDRDDHSIDSSFRTRTLIPCFDDRVGVPPPPTPSRRLSFRAVRAPRRVLTISRPTLTATAKGGEASFRRKRRPRRRKGRRKRRSELAVPQALRGVTSVTPQFFSCDNRLPHEFFEDLEERRAVPGAGSLPVPAVPPRRPFDAARVQGRRGPADVRRVPPRGRVLAPHSRGGRADGGTLLTASFFVSRGADSDRSRARRARASSYPRSRSARARSCPAGVAT
jgi:hypothetical protein